MVDWITANIATVIICIIIAVLLIIVIKKMLTDGKNGKTSCGGNCGNCPMGGSCNKNNENFNSERD